MEALAVAINEPLTTDIKLALKGPQRDPLKNLHQIKSVTDARRFFKRTRNPIRLREIAFRGIILCASLGEIGAFVDFVSAHESLDHEVTESLNFKGVYAAKFRTLWQLAEAEVKSFADGWKLYQATDLDIFPDLARNALSRTVQMADDPEEVAALVHVEGLDNEVGATLLRRAFNLSSIEQVVLMLKQGDIDRRHGLLFEDAIRFIAPLFEKK